MRPKLQIARLEGEVASLRAHIATLTGQLNAAGLEPAEPPSAAWAKGLTQQEAALIGLLLAAHPRHLDAFYLDEALPHQDHAADRDLKLIQVLVSRIRKKLGPEAIETLWGRGYRAGDALIEKVQQAKAAAAN